MPRIPDHLHVNGDKTRNRIIITGMHPLCDLEVDVNGAQTFFLDKESLISFSGRLIKLFSRVSAGQGERPKIYKVVFHDLPGGPEAFELVARFCYNGGRSGVEINSGNVCKLRCAAEFLEMTSEIRAGNLEEQTEKFLTGLPFWTWREVLALLKDCESMLTTADSTGMVRRCIDALVAKVNVKASVSGDASSSPAASSSSSSPRFSCDTRSSSEGLKSGWWFYDLGELSICLMERIVKAMIEQGMDNWVLSRFLLYYLRSSLPMLGYSSISPKKRGGRDEQIIYDYTQKVQKEVLETVVGLLHRLERAAVPCRGLFGVLRVASVLNASKLCRKQLEAMIGAQMDQATLDNLLIPTGHHGGVGPLYDVDQVLRFVQAFLREFQQVSPPPPPPPSCETTMTTMSAPPPCWQSGLKKIGCLMDMYIAEVAPDVNLKPCKFQALLESLPDNVRDSCDGLYRALDMYLEVHSTLSEEERVRLCKTINYQKLSFEVSTHIAQNPRFPSRIVIQVLLLQQAKLRSMLDSQHMERPVSAYSTNDSGMYFPPEEVVTSGGPAILYSKQVDYSSLICEENQELKEDLQGMQWRVHELEKVCKKLHSQMSKIAKLKTKNNHNINSRLPRLCS